MFENIVKSLPASRGSGGVSADSDVLCASADSVALPFVLDGGVGPPKVK